MRRDSGRGLSRLAALSYTRVVSLAGSDDTRFVNLALDVMALRPAPDFGWA